MHYVTNVMYDCDYRLLLTFEDGSSRRVDLKDHLDGEVFEPLGEISLFRTAQLNTDIDTVVWANGVDMSPDFLYEIGEIIEDQSLSKVAEEQREYIA